MTTINDFKEFKHLYQLLKQQNINDTSILNRLLTNSLALELDIALSSFKHSLLTQKAINNMNSFFKLILLNINHLDDYQIYCLTSDRILYQKFLIYEQWYQIDKDLMISTLTSIKHYDFETYAKITNWLKSIDKHNYKDYRYKFIKYHKDTNKIYVLTNTQLKNKYYSSFYTKSKKEELKQYIKNNKKKFKNN
ncbi:hypothetical protein GE118_00405 [Mycoplasma sp. NEAQ87857]|uniref:hypothetical protein n=1 Tax=Mycoplasma sp. NEAQ87857 TaxID=2683967 RepID=UPI00131950DA|nr:hypothetical protein [Mycoplasma sp. NEAQ87857]QGZ97265.1 hypothetical protein GE118_00405 [Mycoplasma sp. NEAQ87857]